MKDMSRPENAAVKDIDIDIAVWVRNIDIVCKGDIDPSLLYVFEYTRCFCELSTSDIM